MEAERVAELSGMSRVAVSALVDALEGAGLASRRRPDHDGRASTLT
jgi:DNA-binding MarR family transcriptional regulator